MPDRLRVVMLAVIALLLTALVPAATLAHHSLEHRVEQSRSRYELGRMYEQAGDLTRAEDHYQQAIDLWRDNVDARGALQRLLDSRQSSQTTRPFGTKWLSWLPTETVQYIPLMMELTGGLVMLAIFGAIFLKFGKETIHLALLRYRGIPLLGLGEFADPTGRLPGLPHQLATHMNEAGLTFYDEKGAVMPNFDFIGDAGFTQARLLARLLALISARNPQRIQVSLSLDGEVLNAAVSMVDSGSGYVRYLSLVSISPEKYAGAGELTRVVAEQVATSILIALARDSNTRGLLYQRMGDWSAALKEFVAAASEAERRGQCADFYQAHLNLGNLYSFLGLQDKSIAAYNQVAEKAKNPVTLALIHAAMACSYLNWKEGEPGWPPNHEQLAKRYIAQAISSLHKTPLTAYTIACYFSLAGLLDEALHWLREAVAGNLAYLDYAMGDPDMENLRRGLGDRPLGQALGLRIG